MMVVLIDNYDSFSYNLYQLIGTFTKDILVIRNDEKTISEILEIKPDAIVLSPGPGKPKDAGICEEVVREIGKKIPILGVCLGHQAICEAYGGTVTYAKQLMHGKQSRIEIDCNSELFKGMNKELDVARYHSLAVLEESLPDALQVIGRSEEGEIMAVQHKEYPVYGLQFHPESILTPEGETIMKHFLEGIRHD